jgi:hypothetical protein
LRSPRCPPDDPGRQKLFRVGSFSREEASAVLNATFATLPKGVASDAAIAAVKARVLPLTTLAKFTAEVAAELRGSASEADLRARTEAWASAFEAKARIDVTGALTLEHITLNGRQFTVADLMRDLLGSTPARPSRFRPPSTTSLPTCSPPRSAGRTGPRRPLPWTSSTRRSTLRPARTARRRQRRRPRAQSLRGSGGVDLE